MRIWSALSICAWLGLASLALPARSLASAPEIRLQGVEVYGVTVFPSETIQGVVSIGPGDSLDRAKVIKTEESIQALYHRHGYDQAAVQATLSRARVLEFHVAEGLPTRVAGVDFVEEPPDGSAAGRQAWEAIRSSLAAGVGIQDSDVLDREKIDSAKRSIQDVLGSQDFVGAKIAGVDESPVAAPPGAAGEALQPAAGWVRLRFRIELGDRVTFGFRGNRVIGPGRLSSLVEEQRALGLGQDFVTVIRSKIEDEYRALGYARVHVDTYSFEQPGGGVRHVTYDIQEGPRVRIDSIDFDGNAAFSPADLRDRFHELAPAIVQSGYYVEDDVRKTAELLIEWIKSKGYLGAKLVTINCAYVPTRREDPSDSRVKLVIYLYESEQTVVQSIKITGAGAIPPGEIEKQLSIREGAPLNIYAFSEGMEKLKATYRAKGYLAISIAHEGTDKIIRYSDDNRLADISIDLTEGPQYRVSRIVVEGAQRTREHVITRELRLKPGDVLEEPKLADAEARLRKLGIFSVVRVSTEDDPDKPNFKIVRVTVSEADRGAIAGGPGFRNDLGVRAFGQAGYNDLWGEGHSISLNVAANRRLEDYQFVEYQAQLAYNWPWFEGYDITFRPSVSLAGTEFALFDAVTADFSLAWEKKLLEKPNLVGSFSYDLQRIHQFGALNAIDDGYDLIGSVTPTLRLDMRDNPLNPTRGFYSQVSFDVASPYLGSQRSIGYWRFQTRTDYTVPLAKNATWLFSIRTGFEKSTASSANDPGYGQIPLIEQFALGGIETLRGYSEQELNVQNEAITGTLSYVDYRTQIDLPVSGPLRFGPFLDAANLLVDRFSFGGLLYGAGVGLRYATPIGPVSLDYGVKLNPIPGTETSQIYFSIGVM